jgi:drug/metabolite transporter (DMT)-like permease
VGAVLALASALCYGVADFTGGLLSRRANGVAVALAGQAIGFVLTLVVAPLVPAAGLGVADLLWGALSGVGTGIGMVYLYRALTHGAMSVVVPVSAVGGLALPVLVGVALLGERPSPWSWLGIALAAPALWLVAQSRAASRCGPAATTTATTATVESLVASAGIALQYVALAQAGPGAGIWPVVAGRLAATLVIVVLAVSSGARLRMSPGLTAAAGLNGGVAALALVCYLLAARTQLVTVAVVLSSLYPVIPVLLGITALRERLTARQVAGLVGAAVAVVLLTAS